MMRIDTKIGIMFAIVSCLCFIGMYAIAKIQPMGYMRSFVFFFLPVGILFLCFCAFFLLSVIYCVSTFYDFSLTYLNFKFNSDGFFKYEFSFLIKRAFDGDPFFCMLMIVFFMLPLIITYGLNIYFVKRYGKPINAIRPVLFAVWFISGLHIVGGLTNFFYLINME